MEEIQRQLNELLAWKKSLERSSTIPLNIDQSFRERLDSKQIKTSIKEITSENQAVDEAGSATYDVLTIPDGFGQTTLEDGSIIYIPYFTT